MKNNLHPAIISDFLYLHSSMDRFEVLRNIRRYGFNCIYIPVWIDLKCRFRFSANASGLNLHSSMDRFEDCSCKNKAKATIIYIPVWIDLKKLLDTAFNSDNKNLHSSMDRFEVCFLYTFQFRRQRFTFQYG